VLKSIPIRISILFNFISITLIGFILVVSVQYFYSNKLALSAAESLFRNISRHVAQKMITLDKRVLSIIDYLDEVKSLSIKPVIGERHPAEHLFEKVIRNKENIYAVYVGYADGSFYEVVNMALNENVKADFGAPDNSRWAVVKIIGGTNDKHIDFLDINLNLIQSVKHLTDYDPRKRPWYKDAETSGETIRTAPYTFANIMAKGITYAKKLDTDIIVGVDFSLNTLSEMLNQEKVFDETEIFMLDKNSTLIASTFNNHDSVLNDILALNPAYGVVSLVEINGVKCLTKVKQIDSKFRESDKLALYIPYSVVVKPYTKIIKISFIVTLCLSFIMFPIMLLSTKIIVKPLKHLMRENKLISQRKFSEVTRIKTIIKEYQDISLSMVNMSNDIEAFQLSQQKLFDSFVKLITEGIDDKSDYTGRHCKRVPVMAEMLTKAACESNEGVFADFKLEGEEQWRELYLGAWLHDCGKLITPEYVVDKATKLETIYNRIHEIRTRCEVIWRDLEIESFKRKSNGEPAEDVDQWLVIEREKLTEDYTFIAEMNSGDIFVTDEHIKKLNEISQREWVAYFDDTIGLTHNENLRLKGVQKKTPRTETLLDDKKRHLVERKHFDYEAFEEAGFKMDVPEYLYNYGEKYNLSIKKGTLTAEERFKINEHITMSIKMLNQLPFPEHLQNVTEYAVSHHETMIGTGYPRKLTKDEMSIPARIMAVADIFEALTASDRPYKRPNTLSESVRILSFMAKDKHIDEDLFKLFLESGVYAEYAKQFLKEEQIDEVDIERYL
jgi:HD-GYP domain-containing protein (c-di-GMP phosphodiesterase class II)